MSLTSPLSSCSSARVGGGYMGVGMTREFTFQLPLSPPPPPPVEIKQETLSRPPSLDLDLDLEDRDPDYCPSPKSMGKSLGAGAGAGGNGNGSGKRRKGAENSEKKEVTLPPPPTRTRRIIQMAPNHYLTTSDASPPSTTTKSSHRKAPDSATKKKISRKTAHSVIERRRRGKMNDEFESLKSIIPACNGERKEKEREMHKLEILRASVEYIRHLEQCVAMLKAPTTSDSSSGSGNEERTVKRRKSSVVVSVMEVDDDMDIEMLHPPSQPYPIPTAPISAPIPHPHPPPTPRISPAILPQNYQRPGFGGKERQYSYSSSSYTPPFGPQSRNNSCTYGYTTSSASSVLTSPAMEPIADANADQETASVGAALLMLGQSCGGEEKREYGYDGRWGRCRGLSVRDLLSE